MQLTDYSIAQNFTSSFYKNTYSLQVKSKFFSNTVVGISQLNSVPNNNSATELGEDNIGRKLMKLMGWEGGGLGKNEQGIEEPIAAGLQVQREGLGLIKNDSNAFNFRNKVRDYVENWMNSETNNDLVFSTEFNTEERKVIHE